MLQDMLDDLQRKYEGNSYRWNIILISNDDDDRWSMIIECPQRKDLQSIGNEWESWNGDLFCGRGWSCASNFNNQLIVQKDKHIRVWPRHQRRKFSVKSSRQSISYKRETYVMTSTWSSLSLIDSSMTAVHQSFRFSEYSWGLHPYIDSEGQVKRASSSISFVIWKASFISRSIVTVHSLFIFSTVWNLQN